MDEQLTTQKRRRLQQEQDDDDDEEQSNSPAAVPSSSSADAVEYYDSLVNRLSKEEVDAVIEHYEQKYQFVTNAQGCRIMGKKIKQPRKRGSVQPVWGPLARKTDGYLQVTVAGIEKESARFKELFPNGKAQKVEWHRLCWRKHNNYAKCVQGQHICHRCGNRDCGTRGHLVQSSREINEEQKHCRYLYFDDPSTGKRQLLLQCIHQPPCIPALEAQPLQVVNDPSIQSNVRYL